MSDKKGPTKEFKSDVYTMMFRFGIIFLGTAVLSMLVGRFLENRFDLNGLGMAGSMVIGLFVSWWVVYMVYKTITKDLNRTVAAAEKEKQTQNNDN